MRTLIKYFVGLSLLLLTSSCQLGRIASLLETDKISKQTIDSLITASYSGTETEAIIEKVDSLRKANLVTEATSDAIKSAAYFNKELFNMAELHASKAINARILRNDEDGLYYIAMGILSYCRMIHGDYSDCINCCNKAIDNSERYHLPYASIMCLENLGDAQIETGMVDEGFETYMKALKVYRDMIANKNMENRHFNYMICLINLMWQMANLNAWDRLIELEPEALKAVEMMPEMKVSIEEYRCSVRYSIYNCLAQAYYGKGQKATSDKYLALAQKEDKDMRESLLLLPDTDYDMLTGNYRAVVKNIEKTEKIAKENNYSILNIPYIKSCSAKMIKAYIRLGELDKAELAVDRMMEDVDSLYISTVKNNSRELAVIYEAGKKDKQIEQMKSQIAFLVFVVLLLLGFTIALFTAMKMKKSIIIKDKTAFKNIDAIINYNEQNIIKEEKSSPSMSEPANNLVNTKIETNKDKILFAQIEKRILEEKLFLIQDLTKERLSEIVDYPRYKISALFLAFSGKTINNYLNDLRCDYAIRLLKDKNNYTIDAIAYDSGFGSKASFYRTFNERFSITPSDYRKYYFESVGHQNEEEKTV